MFRRETGMILAAAMFCSGTVLADSLTVINNDDFGPGSFRDAVEQANHNPAITLIKFPKGLDPVALATSVVYAGSQALKIQGGKTVIEGVAGADFDLFVSEGGAPLMLNSLTFRNTSRNGVVVRVPAQTQRDVSLSLHSVTIRDTGFYGLHMDDLAGSPASLRLMVSDSEFVNNGVAALDFDGIRVDERGEGGIDAIVIHSRIDGNGADGIELDEAGPGSVALDMIDTTLQGNGFFNAADLDDGIDIDEADEGDVEVRLVDVSVKGNRDEGIDLDEAGPGSLAATLVRVAAEDNANEAVKLDEEGTGDIIAVFNGLEVESSGEDGARFTETGDGDMIVEISHAAFEDNAKFAMTLEQAGSGSGSLELIDVSVDGNASGDVNLAGVNLHP